MTHKPGIPDEGTNTVDFVTAHAQTKNYRDFLSTAGFNEIAFHIKKEDLLSALQITQPPASNPNINGIRVYMALEDFVNGKTHAHMYVVATDKDSNDIIEDSHHNSLIYDMTWPCPNLCSGNNLLNSDIEEII